MFHEALQVETVWRVRQEFIEMPGLCLTQAQARQLWRLDEQTCAAVLSAQLTTALATLAARYHHADATDGRTFRVFACGYPAVRSRGAATEAVRQAGMEAK